MPHVLLLTQVLEVKGWVMVMMCCLALWSGNKELPCIVQKLQIKIHTFIGYKLNHNQMTSIGDTERHLLIKQLTYYHFKERCYKPVSLTTN